MHILPQLREIEKQYPDDVAVIGVHSGKYIAERETPRIREASLRYEITHPIVNDRQFRVWRSYAVNAWPTLAVIDRNGYVVGAHAGEFTAEMLQPLLRALVSLSAEQSRKVSSHFPAEKPGTAPSFLKYPGKIVVDGERIAISDTGNHRVLIGKLEREDQMRVQHIVTAVVPTPGRETGEPRELQSPQGLAFDDNRLYVADSENHTVSVIDLHTGKARTLAGTGKQMRTRLDRDEGALSSPWDLSVVEQTIYVAMTGIHQIWAIDSKTGGARVHSGTDGEDIAGLRQQSARVWPILWASRRMASASISQTPSRAPYAGPMSTRPEWSERSLAPACSTSVMRTELERRSGCNTSRELRAATMESCWSTRTHTGSWSRTTKAGN